MFFSFSALSSLLFVHHQSKVFSRFWKKIISFAGPQNTKFLSLSFFLSLRGRTPDYHRQKRESCVIYHRLIKHFWRYTHQHFNMSSTPNVPSAPPSDPFAPNPPPVPGILITKVRFLLNRFLKREKERETNNRNVLLREDHLSSHPLADFLRRVSFSSSLSSSFARGEWCEVLKRWNLRLMMLSVITSSSSSSSRVSRRVV